MKTNLNRFITSKEEAKAYLSDLHSNGEAYHPDDSADSVEWLKIAPNANECVKMDALMDACRDFLDPCEELLALEHKEKMYNIGKGSSVVVGISGYVLYLSNIQSLDKTGIDICEYLNVGEVGDTFENSSIKITRTK